MFDCINEHDIEHVNYNILYKEAEINQPLKL